MHDALVVRMAESRQKLDEDFTDLMQRLSNQRTRAAQLFDQGKLSATEKRAIDKDISAEIAKLQKDAFEGGGLNAGELAQHQKAIGGLGQEIRADGAGFEQNPQALTRASENLDRRINHAEKAGLLSADEAKALRQQVTDAGKLSPLDQSYRLGTIENDLRTKARDAEIDPKKQIADFNRRIADGEKDGSLTSDQAAKLREQVGQLMSGGGCQLPATRQAFADVNRAIWNQRHDATVAPEERRASASQILADKLKAGQIDQGQFDRWNGALDRAWARYTDPAANTNLTDGLGARLNQLYEAIRQL